MKRVTGIGGIFFKAKDPAAFPWTDAGGMTVWSIGAAGSEQFAPGKAPFMINYRVEDVRALVKVLKKEGCEVLEKIDESDFGIFAWVIDPKGNKLELWQPPAGQ
ncbi:MAG: VOC family protein [Planctomycetota bacterium]|nr:VOC family protein [Planctomycetota bacterium]